MEITFPFSDTIAGYVTHADPERGTFAVRTSDDREFRIHLKPNTYAQMLRNLGEPYIDCTAAMPEMLVPGRYLYTYGIFYPQAGAQVFEAQFLVFVGHKPGEYLVEKQDWWVRQVRASATFISRPSSAAARSITRTTAPPSS